MASPTITRGSDSVVFTFQDGDCLNVTTTKNSSLDATPLPASDSDSAFVIDVNGVLRTINLSGQITAASSTRTSSGTTQTIQEQIDWLQTLCNGSQTGHTLTTTYLSSKTVYCSSISFDEVAGDPLKIDFNIQFIEGA